MAYADLLELNIDNSYLTLDSSFDSEINKFNISFYKLIPVIKPNPRNAGREKRYLILSEFEPLEHIYKERHKMERSFAWEDKYRKLVIRYERLQRIHSGFRHMAFTMINFREIFRKKL